MDETKVDAAETVADSGVAAEELKQFIERLERVAEEIAGLRQDYKDVMTEATGRGFDKKAIVAILKLRAKDHSEVQEEEAILELYKQALGMA